MAKKQKSKETIPFTSFQIPTDMFLEAVRSGVADGVVRLLQAPGVFPAADILTAIEEGTAKGIETLGEMAQAPIPPSKKAKSQRGKP
jgi:hypothetical protein